MVPVAPIITGITVFLHSTCVVFLLWRLYILKSSRLLFTYYYYYYYYYYYFVSTITHGIYNYMLETNHVSMVYSVPTAL
jgi:hypothetical protein